MDRPSFLKNFALNCALIAACAVTLYPVLWVIKMALSPSQGFSLSLSPIPETVSLSNFREIFMSSDIKGNWLFGRQLFNSVVISAMTTLFGIFFAATAAYALSRFEFVGKKQSMSALLVTQMFPGVVMAIPLYVLLNKLSLLNSMTGLALVYSSSSVPFCIFMLKGYFDTIPREIEEAAAMDGAGQWTIFTRIVLPLSKPAIVVTALFSFMTAWNEFILAATFLSDERAFTLPVTLQRYVGSYSTEWGHFAAGAIIVSVPVMALFFALQRHLVGGLTSGGVKG